MGRTACTEPQCLYKGALYLPPYPKYNSGCFSNNYISVYCIFLSAISKNPGSTLSIFVTKLRHTKLYQRANLFSDPSNTKVCFK